MSLSIESKDVPDDAFDAMILPAFQKAFCTDPVAFKSVWSDKSDSIRRALREASVATEDVASYAGWGSEDGSSESRMDDSLKFLLGVFKDFVTEWVQRADAIINVPKTATLAYVLGCLWAVEVGALRKYAIESIYWADQGSKRACRASLNLAFVASNNAVLLHMMQSDVSNRDGNLTKIFDDSLAGEWELYMNVRLLTVDDIVPKTTDLKEDSAFVDDELAPVRGKLLEASVCAAALESACTFSLDAYTSIIAESDDKSNYGADSTNEKIHDICKTLKGAFALKLVPEDD